MSETPTDYEESRLISIIGVASFYAGWLGAVGVVIAAIWDSNYAMQWAATVSIIGGALFVMMILASKAMEDGFKRRAAKAQKV